MSRPPRKRVCGPPGRGGRLEQVRGTLETKVRAAVAATAVVMCAGAVVAYDVGPGPDAGPAFAEPVRNATIVIDQGGVRKGYATPQVSVSGGGSVTVVNLDSFDHTVTSVAKGPDGLPAFDVLVAGKPRLEFGGDAVDVVRRRERRDGHPLFAGAFQ